MCISYVPEQILQESKMINKVARRSKKRLLLRASLDHEHDLQRHGSAPLAQGVALHLKSRCRSMACQCETHVQMTAGKSSLVDDLSPKNITNNTQAPYQTILLHQPELSNLIALLLQVNGGSKRTSPTWTGRQRQFPEQHMQ